MADRKKSEEQEGEEEEEITFEKILLNEFKDMNDQLDQLKITAKELDSAADAVRAIVYAPIEGGIPEEFKDPQKFRNTLDNLHKYIGIACDYVLRLEKQRGVIFSKEPEGEETTSPRKEESQEGRPALPTPINVTVDTASAQQLPAPPSPPKVGVFSYMLEKDARERAERKAEEEAQAQQQPVVSTRKIVDIVEYGRQLQPAFNEVKRWLGGTLAEIKTYPDEYIYFVRHEELATYLGQTLGSLVVWVNACLEYRKNLIEGRKLGLWRSVAKIAESQALAPQIQTGGTFMPGGMKLSKSGFEERKGKGAR